MLNRPCIQAYCRGSQWCYKVLVELPGICGVGSQSREEENDDEDIDEDDTSCFAAY